MSENIDLVVVKIVLRLAHESFSLNLALPTTFTGTCTKKPS